MTQAAVCTAATASDDQDGSTGETVALLQLADDGTASSGTHALHDAAPIEARRRAEVHALVPMIAAGALLNGGYGPSESYRTAVFGDLGYYCSFALYICMSFGNL